MIKTLIGMFFFVYFGMLISIVSPAFQFKYHDVNPAFEPYRKEFYNLVAKICPNKVKYEVNYYSIQFEKTPDPKDWVGYCLNKINGYTIHVDPIFWKDYPELRRVLIFHELSHCVIYRDHSKSQDNYMYPSINYIDNPQLIEQVKNNIINYCNDD